MLFLQIVQLPLECEVELSKIYSVIKYRSMLVHPTSQRLRTHLPQKHKAAAIKGLAALDNVTPSAVFIDRFVAD